MASPEVVTDSTRADARRCQRRLNQWLLHSALPLWARSGVDTGNGGFYERIAQDGRALDEPRRARVQPRQIFSFAVGSHLGWRGNAREIVERGVAFLLKHYRREDGLYRTLVAPNGAALDSSAFLYDQAFALLGLAAARKLLGPDPALEEAAIDLFDALYSELKRVGPGFYSGLPERFPLLSNPHMHLFEAALAWCALSAEPGWRTLANELGELALRHFIDSGSGALRESFDEAWSPVPGLDGRRVEPGHQFEWAWLLLCWRPENDGAARRAALRLIDIGERAGVRRGVAIDALLDDLTPLETSARLWPQTERLKASALAASLTGESRYWASTVAAAEGLLRYFDTPLAGLWYDRMNAEGRLQVGPAPASSFYHIAAAALALTQALAASESG